MWSFFELFYYYKSKWHLASASASVLTALIDVSGFILVSDRRFSWFYYDIHYRNTRNAAESITTTPMLKIIAENFK